VTAAAPDSKERLLDLLAAEATEGLDPSDQRELFELLEEHRDVERECMQLAAGAVDVALVPPLEPMPRELSQRMERHLRSLPASGMTSDGSGPSLRMTGNSEGHSAPEPRLSFGALGWLAAAACLLLAVAGWWSRLETSAGPGAEPTAVSLADARARLLEEAPDATVTPWQDPSGSGITGDVVWSDELQKGYMRFSGLPANDPTEEQYQLWIFDATRPTGELLRFGEPDSILTQRPVDGGVFDVTPAAEVIVPIRAKLSVGEAVAFAVTVEPPGGVVVSDRSEVPVLALVKG